MDRLILHCDLNNFYASVECLKRPEWKSAPLAVAGEPEKRHGVVLAKNEIAKSYGIRTGDTVWQAKTKAPNLVVVPPHFDDYSAFSKTAFDLYSRYTCYVEPFGADECWLDCTGSTRLFGSGEKIADTIRDEMKRTTGLTLSVGVSFNKIFAKLGSDLKKPDATTVISRQNFKQKVWPLDACEMMTVGKKTYEKLLKMNIRTIGDLAACDVKLLKSIFGVIGEKMHAAACGEDSEPVREYVKSRKIESVGHGMTALRDITSLSDAKSMVYCLSDMVAARMRKYGVRGSGISVNLRYSSDLSHITRQAKYDSGVCTGREIADRAMALIEKHWDFKTPLRTLTVSVYDLQPIDGERQLSFLNSGRNDKAESLERAVDEIREKYGANSISRANLLGKDFIYDKTDDEDFLPFKR